MSEPAKKIYKPTPISGFPEWLPEYRVVEQQWLDHIRNVFESYGFCNIETPAVEELDVLTAKGETDKEIYTLTRLQAEDQDDNESRLGLHFDQTVPLARYTAQHFNELVFPFKRYQIQKVWRGERPQLGRMREFRQCDIDVINVEYLPLQFDAEMPSVIYEALAGLNIGRIQLHISNRKILLGLLGAFDVTDTISVTRTVDKLDKIGQDGVRDELQTMGLSAKAVDSILDLVVNSDIYTTQAHNDEMREGLDELQFVMDQLSHLPNGAVTADLSIVRGLDYYTGTVYEATLPDIPEFTGAICAGGRYDDLAGAFINKHLPGVGISIGFTRLFDVLRHYNYISPGARSPADILIVLPNEDQRARANATAQTLRQRGFKVELYHAPQKLKKQLAYAEKKGINYVWFPPFEDGQAHEVKDMATGKQDRADPEKWGVE